jgi:hypothetical protein
MTSGGPQESDWKVFRELQDNSTSHHERYLAIFRLMRRRDDELANAFNDPRRSRMIVQAAAMHALGLFETDELARFTGPTLDTIQFLAKGL